MRIAAALIVFLLTLAPAFADEELRGDAEKAAAAWPLIEQGALVLDVRSPEEFEAGHLENAVNISYEDVDALAAAIGEDPDRSVVLYCGSGGRAGRAMEALEAQGFDNLYNATGLDALEATKPGR